MTNRTFAVGDIHGCFKAFRSLIEDKIQVSKSDKVILLGDYIDIGTQSKYEKRDLHTTLHQELQFAGRFITILKLM